MKQLRLALPLAVSLATASCQPYDHNWLAKQWTEVMNTYWLSPVFLPTEDVQVGDVYVVDSAKLPTGELRHSVKIDSIPVDDLLTAYYEKRLIFPETSEPPADKKIWRQLGKDVPYDTADAKAPKNVFGPNPIHSRLPLIAMPGFKVERADYEAGTAIFPINVFLATFVFSRSHSDATSVRIPAAEGYELPAQPALAVLQEYCGYPQNLCSSDRARIWLGSPTRPRGADDPDPSIAIVRRVVLTRSIEFTYDANTTVAAQASVVAQLTDNVNKAAAAAAPSSSSTTTTPTPAPTATPTTAPTTTPAATPDSTTAPTNAPAVVTTTQLDAPKTPTDAKTSTDTKSPTDGKTSTDTKPPAPPSTAAPPNDTTNDAAKRLAAAIEELNKAARPSSPVPGGTFTVASSTTLGATLTQVFERPIAIGFAAVSIKSFPPTSSTPGSRRLEPGTPPPAVGAPK